MVLPAFIEVPIDWENRIIGDYIEGLVTEDPDRLEADQRPTRCCAAQQVLEKPNLQSRLHITFLVTPIPKRP